MGKTPVQRLKKLNVQAYDLYKKHNIDLEKDLLEINVLPQHNNGGVHVNKWWESNIKHLFVIGECAGTHGVYRPGGAALNSGQVGGMRAAYFIKNNYLGNKNKNKKAVKNLIKEKVKNSEKFDDTETKKNLLELQNNNLKYLKSFLKEDYKHYYQFLNRMEAP
ncbi:MAG: hypothetical protein DRH90_25785 [Deltaproteobacteria bacterium]|nr:MAG: hypothetical protein DRH90_25785 [Deltaproteobacteria bacterium]